MPRTAGPPRVRDLLTKLDNKWKAKGWGIRLGKFRGNEFAFSEYFDAHLGHFRELDIQDIEQRIMAFMDDILLFAASIQQAREMIDEISIELGKVGLQLSHGPCKCLGNCKCKCMWMIDAHSQLLEGTNLHINGIPLKRVYQMNILGSIITDSGCEKEAINHRISCSWTCFQKWAHIFCSSAGLSQKLRFWQKTVFRSLSWGLQTLRHNQDNLDKLETTMKLMVRRMLGLRRRPVFNDEGVKVGCEEWVEFYKRSMSRAGKEVRERNMRMRNLVGEEVKRWAGHISRLGIMDKPEHQLKGLLAWRCKFWWQIQQSYNDLSWDTLLHTFPFKPARWEDQFSSIWMIDFSGVPEPPIQQ